MKAYSLDLRRKILDTYNIGGISQRQLAKRFGSIHFWQIALRLEVWGYTN
ncbi:MAG: hypothetical protein V7L23_36780 [Nostoc sp.]